ncbi:hypothetical protein Trydic_g12878 [Trypoxylus dichotomus]
MGTFSSANNPANHTISRAARDYAIYSDSVVDLETRRCICEDHVIDPSHKTLTYPVVECSISISSASEYTVSSILSTTADARVPLRVSDTVVSIWHRRCCSSPVQSHFP